MFFFYERVQLIYNCENDLYSPSYLKFIDPPFKFQILSLTHPYSNLITEWYVCGVIHLPQSGMISDISLCACLSSHLIYQLPNQPARGIQPFSTTSRTRMYPTSVVGGIPTTASMASLGFGHGFRLYMSIFISAQIQRKQKRIRG